MSNDAKTRSRAQSTCGVLEVHLLGMVDYDSARALQEQLVYEISGRDDSSGVLLLCEHPPVVTMGREASRSDLLIEQSDLLLREIPVRWVARGGGAYVHAPGQVAAYLLVPLNRLGLGVSEFRSRFESAMLATCHELRVPAKRHQRETGIWGRSGHLAYFGACVRSWVSCQGMFLNVAVDPGFLSLAVTNPVGEKATSIQAQRLSPVSMARVRESLVRQIGRQFEYDDMDVSTGHPLLKRTIRKVCVNA